MNELTIVLNDDGTVSVNATKMKGSNNAILDQLKSLAASVGGDLTVEKHIEHAHSHGEEGAHVHE